MNALDNWTASNEERHAFEREILQKHADAKAALAESEAHDLWEMALTKVMVKLVKNIIQFQHNPKESRPNSFEIEMSGFNKVSEITGLSGYQRLEKEIGLKYGVTINIELQPATGDNWSPTPAYIKAVVTSLPALSAEMEKTLTEILAQVRDR